MKKIRTRFAPSPTGYMHIGNLRTALYSYLCAKSQGGTFVLRIEDTDQQRFVQGAVEVIYQTLKAAGIACDEGPDTGGAYGPYVQSERKHIYGGYAQELVQKGHAYYCFCDKSEENIKAIDDENRSGYNRSCRDLTPEQLQQKLDEGGSYVIRQKIPLTGVTVYEDAVYGRIEVENESLDDQVLMKRDGMPTYNFANVVDDHLMEISHIVRGADFISSTPKYQLLYEAFGWEVPVYVHLPLIMGQNEDKSSSKLSKRHGATSFGQLMDMGYLPEAIINYIALLGWSPNSNQEIFSIGELENAFSLDRINNSSAIFDYKKLEWMNEEYLKVMNEEDFAELAKKFIKPLPPELEDKWMFLANLLKGRVSVLSQMEEKIAFLRALPSYDTQLFSNKKNKTTLEASVNLLKQMQVLLSREKDWELHTLSQAIEAFAGDNGYKLGFVMWPIRIAVSGLAVTPGGATDILYILGKEESLRRMTLAIQALENEASV